MSITERIDAITGIGDRALENPPIPRSVKVELTARCNLACTFCARSRVLRKQADMDWALYTRIGLEMRNLGVEELGLFYLGESFLLPWLPKAISWAKRVAGYPYVFLTTNGTVASPKKVEACMAAGLDSLKWSLNYADEGQFAEIAGVKRSLYEVMLENVRKAYETRRNGGFSTRLYASYIQYNGEQERRMMGVVERIRPYVDEVYALPLYGQAGFIDIPGEWISRAGNPGRAGNLREPLPCWAAFTEGHVTYDGKLSACCFDHDGRFEMGDLTRESFSSAWDSDAFRALRRAHLARDVTGTACAGCGVAG